VHQAALLVLQGVSEHFQRLAPGAVVRLTVEALQHRKTGLLEGEKQSVYAVQARTVDMCQSRVMTGMQMRVVLAQIDVLKRRIRSRMRASAA